MLNLAVIAFAVAMGQGTSSDEIVVHSLRPSRLLGRMAGVPGDKQVNIMQIVGSSKSLIPDGVHVTANDAAGTLTLVGPKLKVDQVKQYVALFDVKSRQINFDFGIASKLDKYSSTTHAELLNNASWSVRDAAASVEFTIQPRINADGTMTASISVGALPDCITMVFRAPAGSTTFLRLDAQGGYVTKKDGSEPTAEEWAKAAHFSQGKQDPEGDTPFAGLVFSIKLTPKK